MDRITPRPATRTAHRSFAAVAALAALGLSITPATGTSTDELVGVIVRAVPGAIAAAEQAVTSLGGSIGLDLHLIDGFAADVPADKVGDLVGRTEVVSVSPDTQVRLNQTAILEPVLTDVVLEPVDSTLRTLPVAEIGLSNLASVAESVKLEKVYTDGATGRGIDVAVIDSGVVPAYGLEKAGKIVVGPDYSFETNDTGVHGLDTYGHGTHMAGIIAGDSTDGLLDGMAPDARIVSVKVADATGATDVSQVIAGIQWVVENRKANGMNIRVLNLSFGTDGAQDWRVDPLSYAVDIAWTSGIVVVASAGNSGDTLGRLNNPATNPRIIAVGAVDHQNTATTDDDTIPDWSSKGTSERHVDVVAPGRSIISSRNPGSFIDTTFTTGVVSPTLFKGSGTSQAAAVTSGAIATMLSARPHLTPDEVKEVIRRGAAYLRGRDDLRQGEGLLDINNAIAVADKLGNRLARSSTQNLPTAAGTGTLDGARGTKFITDADGNQLRGETDFTGSTWTGSTWTGSTWTGSTWTGSTWTGSTWTGSTWTGSTWTGSTWTGSTWTGSTWTGSTWTGSTWTGSTWTGSTWTSTHGWNGVTWD